MQRFSTLQNKYSLQYLNGYPCNIGFGVSGAVQLAINNHTKEEVVVKKIYNKINSTEIQLHKKLNHPNIIKYLDSYTSPETSMSFIVMEYLPNGTLFQLINKQGIKNKSKIDSIFKEICQGVEYLHSLGIIHRDLKPQNILLDQYSNPKICDFGSAVLAKTHYSTCGSYEYMAPQALLKREYSNKIDIWSLGITLFEMIEGRAPYVGNSFEEILEKMNFPIVFSDKFQQSDIALLKKILRVNPTNRPDIYQLVNDLEQKSMMKKSATTALNLSSNSSKKSQSKLISFRQTHKKQQKSKIKITSVKLIGNIGSLGKLCNSQDGLQQLCYENTFYNYKQNLTPKYQQSRQLNKTWSKISLKKSKMYEQ